MCHALIDCDKDGRPNCSGETLSANIRDNGGYPTSSPRRYKRKFSEERNNKVVKVRRGDFYRYL